MNKSAYYYHHWTCDSLPVAGKHVDIVYIYDKQLMELTILLSKPIPSSQYCFLELMIVDMDGVGKCCVEHRYKIVCDVNFWHYAFDPIMRTITECLDKFFRGLSDGEDN